MGIILDADVIIEGEKGNFDLATWMSQYRDESFQIAAITVAELWHGVERADGKRRSTRERYLRSLLEIVPVVPYTQVTALEHARIWAELESSGAMVGFYDLIVAATALERRDKLATFNERHFSQVPGLSLIKVR